MAFKKTENGVADPNINAKGRIDGDKPLASNRETRNKELLTLLRKLKPHVTESILTAASIMKSEASSEGGKLRAAVIILDNYKNLIGDLYKSEYDDDEAPEEITPHNQNPNATISFNFKEAA